MSLTLSSRRQWNRLLFSSPVFCRTFGAVPYMSSSWTRASVHSVVGWRYRQTRAYSSVPTTECFRLRSMTRNTRVALTGHASLSFRLASKRSRLTNPHFQLSPLSDTFHGRDVFGPAAAHVALGVKPSDLGSRVDEIVALPPFRAIRTDNGRLIGRIIHIDRFGNSITTIHTDQLSSPGVCINIAGREIHGLYRSYADGNGLEALIGSSGFLEVAVNCGSAADTLGLGSATAFPYDLLRGRRPPAPARRPSGALQASSQGISTDNKASAP